MNLKKFTSSLLLTCFFHQAVSTAAFAIIDDFAGVEAYAQGAVAADRTSLHFKADAAHTAAGVLFYMAYPDGDYSVILGQRDDDPGFCNFGGKSDAGDKTLNVTAARESAEESMGLFAVHDYLLSRAPFADLYSTGADKGELYRMYLYQAEYIDESRFDKKLTEATDSHSKEYKRFKTFKVRDLLGAVINESPQIKTTDGEEVSLYEPLYDMLSTPFYRDALVHLANKKRIPLRVSQKASYIREDDYATIATTTVKWALPYSGELNPGEIVQLTEQEEKEFAYTEAFRQRVMMEIKQKNQRQRHREESLDDVAISPAVEAQPPRGRYTMTEGHLMLVLGHDYAEPTDFLDPTQHRLANIANLKKYFAKYNSMEFVNKTAGEKEEFKRTLIVDDRFIERLADVMDSERQEWIKTGRFPIYHGTTDQNGHAFRIASIINNHLTLNSADHLTRLRYTDLYFHGGANTMDEDVARYGTEHYENGNRDRRLFGNFVLTAGRATSRSTSSTVEYWGNNHSVADPNVKKRFEEGTALLGMDLSYSYYESLFQQFIADTGTAYGNALLLQMFISPDALTGYGATDCMDEKVALTAYQAAQAEYERIAQNGKEDFEPRTTSGSVGSMHSPETEKKKGLFGEVRLLLHPNAMCDSSQLTAYGLDLFPLDAAKQRRFNNKLSAVTTANLGHWFSQKTALIPGSLMEAPVARDLYKMVHKGVTGNDVEDVPNTHSLLHLARFGHIEALKTLIETCPDLLGSINSVDLCNAALASGSYTVTKHVIEDVIRRPINEIFDMSSILTKIGMETKGKFKSSFNYILKHYDFTDVPADVKQTLARLILRTGNDYAIKLVNRGIRPYTDDDITAIVIPSNCCPTEWDERVATVIRLGLVSIEKFASLLLAYMKTAPAQETWTQQNQFIKLLKRGLSPSAINPHTGDPFLFDLPYFQNVQESDFTYPDDFLNIRNQHGLNVLEYTLMRFREGKKTSNQFTAAIDALIKRTNGSLESYIFQELYEFFKHTLQHNNVNCLSSVSPFATSKAQAWTAQIESALQSDHYPAIKQAIEMCPSVALLPYYVKEAPEKMLAQHQRQLRVRLSQEENDWRTAMDKAILAKNTEEINRLSDTIPLTVSCFYGPLGHCRTIQPKIDALPEKKKQMLAEWEARLNEALDSEKYSHIMQVLSEVPDPNYTLTDERLKRSNEGQKIAIERIKLRDQLMAEFKADSHAFMAKVDTIDFTLFDPWLLDGFFKDEYAPYIQSMLNQLFKDVAQEDRAAVVLKPIHDNDTTPFIMKGIYAMPSRLKVTRAILEWAGCSDVLKGMTENQMGNFFRRAQGSDLSLLDFVFDQAPDVLSSTEPGKDFFKEALYYAPDSKIGIFARANIPTLKEPDATGFPRFFHFHLCGSHEELLMELIGENPSLLDFRTSMGLSLEDLTTHVTEGDMDAPFLKRLLGMKQKFVNEGRMS